MYLHAAEPKTAAQLIARLTEVEKGTIRGASNPDRLEYLRQVAFASDNISPEVMLEVKDKIDAAFRAASQELTFGATWKY